MRKNLVGAIALAAVSVAVGWISGARSDRAAHEELRTATVAPEARPIAAAGSHSPSVNVFDNGVVTIRADRVSPQWVLDELTRQGAIPASATAVSRRRRPIATRPMRKRRVKSTRRGSFRHCTKAQRINGWPHSRRHCSPVSICRPKCFATPSRRVLPHFAPWPSLPISTPCLLTWTQSARHCSTVPTTMTRRCGQMRAHDSSNSGSWSRPWRQRRCRSVPCREPARSGIIVSR